MGSRPYRGIVHSSLTRPHPNFRFLTVDTVYEKQDYNGELITVPVDTVEEYLLHDRDLYGDIFYVIYGNYWIDIPFSSLRITETESLAEAIHIAEQIMGSKIEARYANAF